MALLDRIKKFFEKVFYNPNWRCLACGKEIFENQNFCDTCKKTLPYNDGAICEHCGRAVASFEPVCSTCKNILVDLDKCRSSFVYAPPISMLIKKAKYDNGVYIIDYFAKELSVVYFQNYFNADLLVYVPMSVKAEKRRGYNQSKILAEKLSKIVNVPVVECIKKKKETTRQATLSRAERLKNITDAFIVTDKKAVIDKTIVIVDDVTTTGATAQIIAQKLKKAGAKSVNLITVASTPPVDKY